MGVFKKKKKSKEELDARFDDVYKEIRAIDDWEDPRKIEHYILDSCEQIVTLTKEIEGEKKQVRVINSYLADVEKLSTLPADQRKEISETAKKVTDLSRARDTYLKKDKRVTDSVFVMMQENEQEMPRMIERMSSNETYQEKVKRDMSLLEGERGEAQYEIDENRKSLRFLRRFSIIVLVAYAIIFILLLAVKTGSESDISVYFLAFLFVGAILGLSIFLRQSALTRTRRRRIRQMNQTTSLLNAVRVKYAAVTRALEYEKERFQVGSSYELNYKWEAYLAAVRERAQYVSDNDDLEYFSGKLMRLLSPLNLYDRRIWLTQPASLIKAEDLQKVKKKLLERKEKIEAEIREDKASLRSERDEINRLMREHDYYVPEIMEIISSVDRICGLSASK